MKSKKIIPGKVLDDAIKTYGIYTQIERAIEEMAELIVELQHFKRGASSNVEEETADVKITLMSLEKIFNKLEIDATFKRKIKRLHERIIKERASSST